MFKRLFKRELMNSTSSADARPASKMKTGCAPSRKSKQRYNHITKAKAHRRKQPNRALAWDSNLPQDSAINNQIQANRDIFAMFRFAYAFGF